MNDAGQLETVVVSAKRRFTERFGVEPTWIGAAPGRVNLIGDHVDYNGGFVLPFAIEKYTVVAAAPCSPTAEEKSLHVFSVQQNSSCDIDLSQTLEPTGSGWAEYVKGVVHGFQLLGAQIQPMRMLIDSTVPAGSGLSSSAALEVAVATMLEVACDLKLAGQAKALLCQQAEHDFAKVPCGLMDQYVSVHGKRDHLLLLDCLEQSHRQVPFDHENLTLLIINSHVQHALGNSEYPIRRQRCKSAAKKLGIASLRLLEMKALNAQQTKLGLIEFRRAKHVVSENDRTLKFVDALKAQDWPEAGRLMYQSHESLRDDYEVSCPELDRLVQIASDLGSQAGVYGARMTGGGFGGSVVMLVKRELADDVSRIVLERFNSIVGWNDATAFRARPASGAHSVEAN